MSQEEGEKRKMVPHFRVFGGSTVLYDLTIDNFMKYNPPCKKCLVQSMCLKPNDNVLSPWIRTRLCVILNEFILINKFIKMTLG